MGKRLEAKVWASALRAELKPLAAAIADIADDDGYSVFAGVDYYAWLLGEEEWWAARMSKDHTVQRHLSQLLELGVLQVLHPDTGEPIVDLAQAQQARRKGGRRRPTRDQRGTGNTTSYRVVEAALPSRRPWTERYGKGDKASLLKGDIASPLRAEKAPSNGDNVSPLRVTNEAKSAPNSDIVSPLANNGDIASPLQRRNGDMNPGATVTSLATSQIRNGDTMSPDPLTTKLRGREDVGSKIKLHLAARITRQNFDSYIANARFEVRYGQLVITAPNDAHADWLRTRMQLVLLQACASEGVTAFEVITMESALGVGA